MPTNYILIDLENVQPKNLNILLDLPFRIYVFVGENQTKIPFDLAATMQSFGENAKYIKISGNGKNALDFHLAYYLGILCRGASSVHKIIPRRGEMQLKEMGSIRTNNGRYSTASPIA
jgi:hypothetical protein